MLEINDMILCQKNDPIIMRWQQKTIVKLWDNEKVGAYNNKSIISRHQNYIRFDQNEKIAKLIWKKLK